MSLRKLVIKNNLNVKETLKRMDEGGAKILFVVDENDVFKGVVSDGDIRRYFLSHGSLHAPVTKVYNPDPMFIKKGFKKEDVKALMIERKVEVLPIVDENMQLVDSLLWTDLFEEDYEVVCGRAQIPVVVMAGGKGERLGPFTNIFPKSLIPMGDKPMIEVIVNRFKKYGADEFYLILNHKGEMIKIYFDHLEKDYKLKYIYEKEFLGTAGGLCLLPRGIGDTFFVSNCDILVKADYVDLLAFHERNDNMLTVVGTIQHHKIPYGIIHFEKEGKIKNIEEKPERDLTVNTGVYVLNKRVLRHIPRNEIFDMPDLIHVLLEKDIKVGVYPVSQQSYVDVGQWEEYIESIRKQKLF